jgi:hypothetical protein
MEHESSLNAYNIPRYLVTIEGMWTGDPIYWTLTTRNYKQGLWLSLFYTFHKSLWNTLRLLSLLQSLIVVA